MTSRSAFVTTFCSKRIQEWWRVYGQGGGLFHGF